MIDARKEILYSIFEPSKKKRPLSNNQIINCFWLLFLLMAFSYKLFLGIDYYSKIVLDYFIILVIISAYFAFVAFSKYEPLHGDFKGFIIFNNKQIITPNNTFELSEMKKIDFSLDDYSGKFQGRMNNIDFNPRLSSGVRNFVKIIDSEDKIYIVNFILSFETQREELYPFIKNAIMLDKISLLSGLNLMRITDYNEIQEFKKTLNQ